MSYAEEWSAIVARIRSLKEAGSFYAQLVSVNKDDSFGVGRGLTNQCKSITDEIVSFRDRHVIALPTTATAVVERYVSSSAARSLSERGEGSGQPRAGLTALAAFEGEMTYVLSGRQERLRLRSFRAFQHLQQLLAVDEEARKRWKEANKSKRGEDHCERLGAVHLMQHGIFAFKVAGIGAVTDLVFREPVDVESASLGAEGLVLTEWKVAKPDNTDKMFEEAKEQAALYAGGVLGGLELRSHRFLVIVTEQRLPRAVIPSYAEAGGVKYHCVNIAIAPLTPSVQARLETKVARMSQRHA